MDNSFAAGRGLGRLPSCFAGSKLTLPLLVAALVLGWSPPSAVASSVFSSGPFGLPEGIAVAPDGDFLVSDDDNFAVYNVPATGGPPTSSTSLNFRPYNEIVLPSGYANSGQYLAYGSNGSQTSGVLALMGASGLGTPTNEVSIPNKWFTTAVVAPTNFGTIAGGDVVLASTFATNTIATSIDTLDAGEMGVSTFTTLPGIDAFGVGFAPTTFGTYAGDMFVSDAQSGRIYTVNAAGNPTLFATLPLPSGFNDPGLRQFAWAPAGFTIPDPDVVGGQEDVGGDLFVSIAAQNGGGGSDGYIDILNGAGQAVGHYLPGTDALDPRGLFFLNNQNLLVANADPGIHLLTPQDFVAGSPVPEPSTWAMLLLGFAGLGFVSYRTSRTIAAAA
jgi:PEP-CTERM motif-containing protein